MAGGGTNSWSGRCILVAEDDYFMAVETAQAFEAWGVEVVGPVASVQDALDLLAETDHVDAAVLDINLQGEMVFPVCDALERRGVPFVFATGYDAAAIPERYAGVVLCEKPIEPGKIARALFG